MHVNIERRRLVVNTPDFARITAAIPHAKTAEVEGETLVGMTYGVEESLVLRNLGFSVPPPILSYYDWPGRFPPMDHQRETAAFLTTHKRALCLNAPGTGKTISALWAADFLLTEGIAKKIIIVAPLSTLKVVWARELRHHLPHRSLVICTGTKAKREQLLQTPGVQYVIINHDGFTNMAPHITDADVVIYDEVTALKTPGSVRYKVFAKWVGLHQPWLWLLTGTPFSQNPTDAWTLARLVDSARCPRSFTTFKDRVMQKITSFKWIARPDALQTVRDVLQPSIRYSLDECKDLPETNYIGRFCDLTAEQKKIFAEMQRNAIATLSNTTVAAPNAAVALAKLVQICCGVVYSDVGPQVVNAKDRFDTLRELVDEIGDKVIVFCPLRAVQDWLYKELQAAGYSVETVHGDVTKNERNRIFNDFQHTDLPQILLAHPKVAAHGLTLTRAKDIIWYAPIYSLEQYEQANARIRRLTTTGKTNVWHIWSTAFERELYRRLRTRQTVLANYLDLVNGVNED